ncbi:F-box only protein 48 [Ascaphus truei]|uniref:F-box only protein 48 n=1 Tax=Ascaphus truei TaxID=8439 RepID=UPI003F5A0B98
MQSCAVQEDAKNFESLLLEIKCLILGALDMKSLCVAARTCKSWNQIVENNDILWKKHCLAIGAVCQQESDEDGKYSWKKTFQINYGKKKVKEAWLRGEYSNIDSFSKLPEHSMCPMGAACWEEIVDAELKRKGTN